MISFVKPPLKKTMKTCLWSWSVAGLIFFNILANGKRDSYNINGENVLMVNLTLIQPTHDKKAVCLDGSLPGYHLHPGYGSGESNWIINLQGGAWCDTLQNCMDRKASNVGSSTLMEKELPFKGILSDKSDQNPDFYNWNRVKVRYCDGASFSGDSENKDAKLQFRGKRVFIAVMEELMAKGMSEAKQVFLNGCSSGGLSAILHCDKFASFFSSTTKVKCMSDAGFFIDTIDILGDRLLRRMYSDVVKVQGLQNMLSPNCTTHLDPTSCFFPENIINEVKTPLFILNSAFDSWQINNSIAPAALDPNGSWHNCTFKFKCKAYQKHFLKGFKKNMLHAVKSFAMSSKNGVLINKRWAHCQAERRDTWFPINSKPNKTKGFAVAVGDWYFERPRKQIS